MSAPARASLLTEIPISATNEAGETVPAWLSLTELRVVEEADGRQLYADGIVSYATEDGQYLAEAFTDQPIELTRAPTEAAGAVVAQQQGPAEEGVCDILYLSLGPLSLDLLGLSVELNNVVLDVDAVPGPGNLLCAVVGLLDGGPLGAILNLLDQIDNILDSLSQLLSNLSAVGSVLSGDATGVLAVRSVDDETFQGTLTITRMAWDESGETLLVDGILDGKARVGGKVTQVRDVAIRNVPATLRSGASGEVVSLQQGPAEPDVCDILFLDLAPTYLNLLGLTVDLSEVVLDVDAVPGSGNLLGNLLCAVTGLLDGAGTGGLGGLLQSLLQGLLDAINQLLGGLSL